MSLLKSTIYSLALLFGIIILSYLYPVHIDNTSNKINDLNAVTKELLTQITKPLQLDVYITNSNTLHSTQELSDKYSYYNENISIQYHNGSLSPEQKLRFGLHSSYHIVATYKNTSKAMDIPLKGLKEQSLTNLINQAFSGAEKWIVFITGNGERDPFSKTNRDLHSLRLLLLNEGFRVMSLDLTKEQTIPNNTSLLIAADPVNRLLPATEQLLLNYVDEGGNLLWLTSPQTSSTFNFLAEHLNIKINSGFLWDTQGLALGSPHGAMTVINQFPTHPITSVMDSITIFPWSTTIDTSTVDQNLWQTDPVIYAPTKSFLLSSSQELQEKQHNIQSEDNPRETISISLTRELQDNSLPQRVIVYGNADFVSNAYINSYNNTSLALKTLHWLTFNDLLLSFKSDNTNQNYFTPTRLHNFLANYLFTMILPLIFLSIAMLIYHKTRTTSWS